MKVTALDRLISGISPEWALSRVRSRAALDIFERHYEAAQPGRRTSGWNRNRGDANQVSQIATTELRLHARDLIRNNGWAKRAQEIVSNNTVGWGVTPKAVGSDDATLKKAMTLWKAWADSTECESDGRATFAGIQMEAMDTIFESGEVLIRKRPRRVKDDLTLPLQLQVLEPDYLDSHKTMPANGSMAGGPIIQGVEFDKLGRRAAYWMFEQHPGSTIINNPVSRRLAASEILHIFLPLRRGAVRGISWLGAAIVPLKDFDDYEDAELVKQKIAACFSAFITDLDGFGAPFGVKTDDPKIEEFQPGMIAKLPPGKQITMAQPPGLTSDALPVRTLRKVAAGIGITYESLTGDWSNVNFSSARMGRIDHEANVRKWQVRMLIPLLCQGIWNWAMEAAVIAGELPEAPGAQWTVSPMAMIEPDKEGLAYSRRVRNGLMTPSEAVREQGHDPDEFFAEYAADMQRLDDLGIILDSDAEAVSAAGLEQPSETAAKAPKPDPAPAPIPVGKGEAPKDDVVSEALVVDLRALMEI